MELRVKGLVAVLAHCQSVARTHCLQMRICAKVSCTLGDTHDTITHTPHTHTTLSITRHCYGHTLRMRIWTESTVATGHWAMATWSEACIEFVFMMHT